MFRARKLRGNVCAKEARGRLQVSSPLLLILLLSAAAATQGQFVAHDPGVRSDSIGAGKALGTLSPDQYNAFVDGQGRFGAAHSVSGTLPGEPDGGLGPRFNSNSCGSCHAQPDVGGTSPSRLYFPNLGQNPQVAVANVDGATNTIPYFVTADGPVREARFPFVVGPTGLLTSVPDGGVHDLYTITGRVDATNAPNPSGVLQTCTLPQPNFNYMRSLHNIIFRIPTPVFGAGMIENISDATILSNQNYLEDVKEALGIFGQPNRSGNDGTITRFGWKAQNKSLEIFAGEAYNVEQGVSNEKFPNERASPGEILPSSCIFNGTPEDAPNFGVSALQTPSDVTGFAIFMRFLDQPVASTTMPGGATSIADGRYLFTRVVQCSLCHTPELKTEASSLTPGLHYKGANLFSDLLVHHMGTGLADGVSQGSAGPDQFRTAPLWGLGQRIFFLHDGRTSDLLNAIRQHASSGSEANGVIQRFYQLSESQKQDLLNFLRSL